MNILFVCTGNTCRSPIAEGYLKELVKNSNMPGIQILSAGLAAFPGQKASENSLKVLNEKGIDISAHQSRLLAPELINASNWILTMTESQKNAIRQQYPEMAEKVQTLSEFSGVDGDVADPYGGSLEEYQKAAEEIIERVDQVWEKLQKEQEK